MNHPLPANSRVSLLKTCKMRLIHNMVDNYVSRRQQRCDLAVDNLSVERVFADNIIQGHPLVRFLSRKRTCKQCAHQKTKSAKGRYIVSCYKSSACTYEPCQWNDCFIKKVEGAPVANIQFYKEPVQERHRRSKDIKSKQPAMPSKEQKSTFLPSLAEGSENMVELCTFKDFLDNIVSTIRRSVCRPAYGPYFETLMRSSIAHI